jgi:hypothetical protein
MANHTADLSRIERRLRQVLELYTKAQARGDFLEAVLAVHNALEDALDAHLGEQATELNFSQKAQALLPQLHDRFEVERLNKQRNFYAHPKQQFTDNEIRDTAVGFVNLALAAWTTLFGHYTSPPAVTHPPVSSPAFSVNTSAAPKPQTPPPLVSAPAPPTSAGVVPKSGITPPTLSPQRVQPGEKSARKTKAPWSALIMGLLLLWPISWLAGFTHHLWRETLVTWLWWPVLLSGLLLILAVFSLRCLWRFLRALGLIRLISALSVALLLATIALTPFMGQELGWSVQAGAALTRVLSFVRFVTIEAISNPYAQGAAQAITFFPAPTTPTARETVSTTPTPLPITVTAKAKTTVVRTPAIAPSEVITIGVRVVVKTDGTRLFSRAGPGRNEEVVTRFENGTELIVRDGPVKADGFTWWEVEGANGRGWSAADFLMSVR